MTQNQQRPQGRNSRNTAANSDSRQENRVRQVQGNRRPEESTGSGTNKGTVRKRKKKSVKQKFFRTFIKSFGIIMLLFLTGFISYKTTLYCFARFGGPTDDKTAKLVNELYGQIDIKDISKNLIYSIDSEKQITGMVLEILNTKSNNMDYITIPMKSEFAISNDLYQKLCTAKNIPPQIIMLGKIDNYFSNTTLFEYGVILLEDMLDMDIDYYTAVPRDTFLQMFHREKAQKTSSAEGNEIGSYVEYKLKDSYLKEVAALGSDKEWKDYIKKKCDLTKSNLTTHNKLGYLEDYKKINPALIYTHSIYGSMTENTFHVEIEASRKLVSDILSRMEGYTVIQGEQGKLPEAGVSEGQNIEILNASQIDGLAAKYKEKLEAAGYTIMDIGNYTGDLRSVSKILVKEEGIGTDLCSYINDAAVETAEMPEGIDIQIILGTDARIE